MKILTFCMLLLISLGHYVHSQEIDSLNCEARHQELLNTKEAREWQESLFNYQKSKMAWLRQRIRQSSYIRSLDSYDYEWKTGRWYQSQAKLKADKALRSKDDQAKTDSLNLIFSIKSRILREWIAKLGDISFCKQSLSKALFGPVMDSLKAYRFAVRKKNKENMWESEIID
ncbi:MAG: hypothetical protein AB3N14_19310 [Flavobacteriaceae bacterium]